MAAEQAAEPHLIGKGLYVQRVTLKSERSSLGLKVARVVRDNWPAEPEFAFILGPTEVKRLVDYLQPDLGSDLSIGTLLSLLHNQLRGMKGRREFSVAITKLQEVGFWYQQGLREIEADQEAQVALAQSDEARLDRTKPWIHYVPVDKAWSIEEGSRAIAQYKANMQEAFRNRNFASDVFLPEVDGKSTRIVEVG